MMVFDQEWAFRPLLFVRRPANSVPRFAGVVASTDVQPLIKR